MKEYYGFDDLEVWLNTADEADVKAWLSRQSYYDWASMIEDCHRMSSYEPPSEVVISLFHAIDMANTVYMFDRGDKHGGYPKILESKLRDHGIIHW